MPNQSREYVLALFPPGSSSCNSDTGIDTLMSFFRVLQPGGKVLLTSDADPDIGNGQRLRFDAGVIHYVTVDAGATVCLTADYRLFVHEAS